MAERKMKMRPLLLLSVLLLGGCSVNPYSWPGSQPQTPTTGGTVTPPVVTTPEVQPQPKPVEKPAAPTALAKSLADAFVQDAEVRALMQGGNVVLLLTPPRDGTSDQIDTRALATAMGKQIKANSSFQLADPAQVAAITSQLEYQQGSMNPASLVRLGRQTGAGYLLYGDLAAEGSRYRLAMTLMDLHSGELLWSGSRSASQ